MKALLRFQAVVLGRALAEPFGLAQLAVLAILVTLAALGVGDDSSPAALAIVIALVGAVMGMWRTFDAIDGVRWIAPVERRRVVQAHFRFWLAIYAPLALIVAIGRARDLAGAAILFFDLVMLVVAVAAIVMFFQRITRRGFGAGWMAAGVVIGSALVSPAVWSAHLAWTGRWESLILIGVVACISLLLGVLPFLREELEPTTSGATNPRDIAPARQRPRTPVASQRAGIPNVELLIVSAVLALAIQFVPFNATHRFPFATMLLLSATVNLATASLASCRWLLAGPMERGRMFRRRFAPLVLFVAVGVTIRACVEEYRPDRTVFFDTFRDKGARHHDGALVLGQVLDTEDARDSTNGPAPGVVLGTHLVERPPEVPYMAARVREQLERQFGLDVSEERIATSIRRGWPAHWGPNANYWVNEQQDAVFAAMDRVHDDLVGEIVSADRRRIVVNACVSVLLCIVMLRGQRVGFTSRWAFSGVWVAGCAVIFAPAFAPHSSVAVAVVAAERAVLSFVERISLPVALLVFVALALLLWKSCERAFRRLDITDLPPVTNEWGRARTS